MAHTSKARFLRDDITKEDAAALLRSAKNAATVAHDEYRDAALDVVKNIAADLYHIFGPDSADVLALAFTGTALDTFNEGGAE